MGCAVVGVMWAAWCVGVAFVARWDPELYPATAVVVSSAALVFLRAPGFLTLVSRTDLSGKGSAKAPPGCLPITVALDLATAPLQLPLLLPLAVSSLRWMRAEARRKRSDGESPEATRALIARIGKWLLEDRQYGALVEKCAERGAIRREEIATLVELFSGEVDGRSSSAGLIALIEHQPVSDIDLRRVVGVQAHRDVDDRSPDVLAAVARHPATPADLLRDIIALDGAGGAANVAKERLHDPGPGDAAPNGPG